VGALSWHWSEGTDETHGTPQSGLQVPEANFKFGTS